MGTVFFCAEGAPHFVIGYIFGQKGLPVSSSMGAVFFVQKGLRISSWGIFLARRVYPFRHQWARYFLCRRGSAFRHRVYFWLEGFTRFVINGRGIFCAEGAPHFVMGYIFGQKGLPVSSSMGTVFFVQKGLRISSFFVQKGLRISLIFFVHKGLCISSQGIFLARRSYLFRHF